MIYRYQWTRKHGSPSKSNKTLLQWSNHRYYRYLMSWLMVIIDLYTTDQEPRCYVLQVLTSRLYLYRKCPAWRLTKYLILTSLLLINTSSLPCYSELFYYSVFMPLQLRTSKNKHIQPNTHVFWDLLNSGIFQKTICTYEYC